MSWSKVEFLVQHFHIRFHLKQQTKGWKIRISLPSFVKENEYPLYSIFPVPLIDTELSELILNTSLEL